MVGPKTQLSYRYVQPSCAPALGPPRQLGHVLESRRYKLHHSLQSHARCLLAVPQWRVVLRSCKADDMGPDLGDFDAKGLMPLETPILKVSRYDPPTTAK